MPKIRCGASLASLLALLLTACTQGISAPGAVSAPATIEDAAYACRMRGAAAEDAYYWPRRSLGIDGAVVRAQTTDACLAAYRQTGSLPQ
jgi:hypothetical protein